MLFINERGWIRAPVVQEIAHVLIGAEVVKLPTTQIQLQTEKWDSVTVERGVAERSVAFERPGKEHEAERLLCGHEGHGDSSAVTVTALASMTPGSHSLSGTKQRALGCQRSGRG